MAFTLEQLFNMGAHHTVESLLIRGQGTLRDILGGLARRFGGDFADSASAIADLRQRVINAIQRGQELEFGIQQPQGRPGINPTLPENYRYTVIVEIPDPISPGKTISVPYSFDSATPLTQQELEEKVQQDVNSGAAFPDTLVGARGADLIRRRIAIKEAVESAGEGGLDVTISIIGIYQRA